MNKILLYFLLLTIHVFAQAQSTSLANKPTRVVYGYDYWVPQWIQNYQNELLNYRSSLVQPLSEDGFPTCSPVLQKALNRGYIDIRYVFGYFDDSASGDFIQWDGENFGRSPSLDPATFEAFRKSLLAPCQGDLQACGFRQHGDPSNGSVTLEKKLLVHGSTVPVRLTVAYSSASQNFILNTTSLVARQKAFSSQAEQIYLSGIRDADIVFYNGHSRNGGGPDFTPPVLRNDYHPNYEGYYKIKRPGIKKVLDSLKDSSNKELVLGLFSCSSYSHFYTMLTKAAPQTRLILSTDLIDYHDALIASVGYLNGLLQGRCGEDLAQYAKRTPKLYDGFKGYRIK